MKVIVAGATGMIGKRLVPALLKENFDVIVFTRNTEKARNQFGTLLQYKKWELGRVDNLIPYVEQADAIINLAGENLNSKSWTLKQKKIIIESRVQAVKTLAKAIRRARKTPSSFLQASAVGWYGTDVYEPLDENAPKGNGFLADVVEKWENADDEIEKLGCRYVLMRTGVVLTPDEGALAGLALPFKLRMGGHLGSGKQFISWIHYEDHIRAIIYLLKNQNLNGAFNLTAPQPVTMKEFALALSRAFNRPSWFHMPAPLLKLFMGEKAKEMILSSSNIIPQRLLDAGFEFEFSDIQSAFKDLFAGKYM